MLHRKNGTRVAAFAALATISAGLAAQPASAEPRICGPHDKIIATLSKQFQEKQEAIGLAATGQVMEVYVSREGSWTILVSTTNGMTCVIGAGEGWESRLASYDPGAKARLKSAWLHVAAQTSAGVVSTGRGKVRQVGISVPTGRLNILQMRFGG